MSVLSTPRFILSADRAGSGKSLISIGLAVALRKRNVGLSCSVIGSNPLQAVRLKRLTRRYAHNLDLNILSNAQVLNSLQLSAAGADLLLIEGQQGLFDGVGPGSIKGSDAEFAGLTRSPVVLVVDAKGLGTSLAALIRGYSQFAQGFSLEGVIANSCGSNAAGEAQDLIFYNTVMQAFSMSPLLGALPKADFELPDMSVAFSQQNGSVSHSLQFYKDIGSLIEKHIDLDKLLELAGKAPSLRLPDDKRDPAHRRTRIAVAEDTCFNLGYQDNIDLLRFNGAEIVTFSPLADEDVPKRVGALYFSGAMLFEYAEGLANNQSMKSSIKKFLDSGGVIYSEGAGSAYLCEKFEGRDDGIYFDGVGIIPGTAVKDARNFCYNEAVLVEDSVLGRSGTVFKGASLGEWKLQGDRMTPRQLRISTNSVNVYEEGYSAGAQTISTFTFPHFASNPQLAKNLVDAAEIMVKV